MARLKEVDPLLVGAKVLVLFGLIVSGIGTIATVIAIPLIVTRHEEIASALAAAAADTSLWQAQAGVACFLLLVAGLAGAVFEFFRLLDRMIGSVAAEDPSPPANPRRLGRMAWIALGVQLGWLLLEWQARWLGDVFPGGFGDQNWHFQVDGDPTFPVAGLILALVLFILSRVFRHGAAMRADLEGTV
jgi:hypothetical protein